MHITISKVRHQDPLCNTRNLIPDYVSTYIEKEPPKKHVYIYVEVNQLQHIEKKKKKKNQQDFNSPLYSSSNNRLKTEKIGKNANSIPSRQ